MKSTKPHRHIDWNNEESDFQETRPLETIALANKLRKSLEEDASFPARKLFSLVRHSDEEIRTLALDLIDPDEAVKKSARLAIVRLTAIQNETNSL